MDIIFNSPRIGCLSQNINTFPFNYPRILLRGKTLINLINYLYLHFPSRLLLIWEKANQHELCVCVCVNMDSHHWTEVLSSRGFLLKLIELKSFWKQTIQVWYLISHVSIISCWRLYPSWILFKFFISDWALTVKIKLSQVNSMFLYSCITKK